MLRETQPIAIEVIDSDDRYHRSDQVAGYEPIEGCPS